MSRSIPVSEPTRDRLRAYCHRRLISRESYDEAVNSLLDSVGFPTKAELEAGAFEAYLRRRNGGDSRRAGEADDETDPGVFEPNEESSSSPVDSPLTAQDREDIGESAVGTSIRENGRRSSGRLEADDSSESGEHEPAAGDDQHEQP